MKGYKLTGRSKRLNMRYKRMKRNRMEKMAYYAMQKLSGAVLVAIGVIVPELYGDYTFSLLAVPAGAYMIVTSKKIMVCGGVENDV